MSRREGKPKVAYILTMGCQMNLYDSEQMERTLASLNFITTVHPEHADLILVNTCSVREKAEHKVYSHLGRFAGLKGKRPDLIIGVGGCVAQQEGHALIQRAPYVDLVFGPSAVRRLGGLLGQVLQGKEAVVDVGQGGDVEPLHIRPLDSQSKSPTAFVTIMTGCENHCTYCVVPYVRGREVSRQPERILKEINYLVASGVREVTLLGQNVNSFGMKEGHGYDFPSLLEAVNDMDGLRRIRFTTSHPKDLSDRLVDVFARLDKLMPHIHLPVQSGSDRVLKRMNRGYTRDYYLDRIEGLREACPHIAVTSDIIVGFPGEDEIDFEETMKLVELVRFDNLYTFKYSDRPNTRACRFHRKVPDVPKGERFARLLALQTEITLEKHTSFLGTIQEILVEGSSKKSHGQMTGRTPCNKVVNFLGDAACVGEVVPMKIVAAYSHSLLGERATLKSQCNGRRGGTRDAA